MTVKVATSGLVVPPGRVVQIAAAVVDVEALKGDEPSAATAPFAALVDPAADIAPAACKIHGVDKKAIESSAAPQLDAVLESFGGWIAAAREVASIGASTSTVLPAVILVTYSPFDLGALKMDAVRVVGGFEPLEALLRSRGVVSTIDALVLFKDAFLGPRSEGFGYNHRPPTNYKLATLATSFDVGPQPSPHDASEDALLLRDVLLAAAGEDGGCDAFVRRMNRHVRRI